MGSHKILQCFLEVFTPGQRRSQCHFIFLYYYLFILFFYLLAKLLCTKQDANNHALILNFNFHDPYTSHICICYTSFNVLFLDDGIRYRMTWSTLVRVRAWCLTAPSPYLNHWWLTISGIDQWYPPKTGTPNTTSYYPLSGWVDL